MVLRILEITSNGSRFVITNSNVANETCTYSLKRRTFEAAQLIKQIGSGRDESVLRLFVPVITHGLHLFENQPTFKPLGGDVLLLFVKGAISAEYSV